MERAAATFTATDGDIQEVVRAIVTSPDFFSRETYRAKVKTPLEWVASGVRGLDVEVREMRPLVGALNRLDQPLYGAQPPTGYADVAEAWVSSGALLARAELGQRLARAGALGITGRDPSVGLEPFAALYDEDSGDVVLGGPGREATRAIKLLRENDPRRYESDVDYPRSPFAHSMMEIAQLIKADVGLEIAFADLGGWDTHVNQGASQGQLALRLRDFGDSIAAFCADLDDRMEDVVVLTMSEFGRTARENGNAGTDHGHANCLFVIGGGVRGGELYGEWPGLDAEQLYEGRDLALTTDFRDIFAEVLYGHLGIEKLDQVFPQYQVDRAKFLGLMG